VTAMLGNNNTSIKNLAKQKIRMLVDDYIQLLSSGRKETLNKERLRMAFIEPMLLALGWDIEAPGVGIIQWRTDLILTCKNNKLLIRILNDDLKPHKNNAIHRALGIKSDWLVLTNFNETELYELYLPKGQSIVLDDFIHVWYLKFTSYELEFDNLWMMSVKYLETYRKPIQEFKDIYVPSVARSKTERIRKKRATSIS
jgi:hypothetical protein